ncbi:MAG: hypothetical protein ACFFAN_13020 [Promethearchaeota archaeon]
MTNSEKSQKNSVHATISEESEEILELYKDEYGSKSAVVDAAIKTLKRFKEPRLGDVNEIWLRARDELNMVLVGKTTFLSYIKGKKEDVYFKNIGVEVIEWYNGKRIDEMNLEEFLNGIKGMWKVANYFHKIEIDKNEKGVFQMKFNHDLTNNFSSHWAKYFETLLKKHWNCSVESFVRNESFYLIIKET